MPAPWREAAPVVAIVGGGASGTLTAVHLLDEALAANRPLRVVLIDRLGRHGLGQAYATSDPGHLLNTPAHRMSALAGDPGHLPRWAAAAGMGDNVFLPRSAYGQYLRDTLSQARLRAHPLASVTSVTSRVLAIRHGGAGRPLRLLTTDGLLDADVAVLAVGNPAPRAPVPLPDNPRCVIDPWLPGALDAVADGSPVVILGTGLTMLDVATSVTGASPATIVHAVSRHGLLPKVYDQQPIPGACPPPALDALLADGESLRLRRLLGHVSAVVRQHPERWQEVVDSLRPHVPEIWRRLPDRDKRVFLRRLARYWEIHRHRVPPATAARIAALRDAGRLSIRRGHISSVTETGPDGPLLVQIEQNGTTTTLSAGWLINASGPDGDLTHSADPLTRDLLAQGLARPGPLRLGLAATPDGAVIDAAGLTASSLFTLGPPLRGLRYETTAIPEIREQAAALARHLVATRLPRSRSQQPAAAHAGR